MKILGCDPGIYGGLAVVLIENGAAPILIDAIDIPVVGIAAKERIDVAAVCDFIAEHAPQHAYEVGKSIRKLANHGHDTALLRARTEAAWFEPVWESATGILFLADRLHFHFPDGRRAEANSGALACLISFGHEDVAKLKSSGLQDYLVSEWSRQ